jgi:Spy/CpxP family protein refolding chaperone
MVKKLLVVGLLSATLALAQKTKGGGSASMPTAGAAVPTKFDMIATALNLTKDQKKNVKAILDEGAKEAAPLRDQISKSRIVVGEAIAANKSEDELKQVAKTTSDVTAQLTELEISTFAKIFGALDETQKKDTKSLSRALIVMNGIYHTKNWNEE